jgi:ribose 5-phosphate isomerase
VVTDNGNFIIDAPFESDHMLDPFVASELAVVYELTVLISSVKKRSSRRSKCSLVSLRSACFAKWREPHISGTL